MLALRLPPEIEKRLASLAKKTGRSKSFYAREAIVDTYRGPRGSLSSAKGVRGAVENRSRLKT